MYQAGHCCAWHNATPFSFYLTFRIVFLLCFYISLYACLPVCTCVCVSACVCDRKLPFKVHFKRTIASRRLHLRAKGKEEACPVDVLLFSPCSFPLVVLVSDICCYCCCCCFALFYAEFVVILCKQLSSLLATVPFSFVPPLLAGCLTASCNPTPF